MACRSLSTWVPIFYIMSEALSVISAQLLIDFVVVCCIVGRFLKKKWNQKLCTADYIVYYQCFG